MAHERSIRQGGPALNFEAERLRRAMCRVVPAAFVSLLALIAPESAFAQDATISPPSLVALHRGEAPVRVDGRLDEPIWQQAEMADGFVERRPVRGAIPPVGTRFRVLYDENALYVGIECDLAEGEVPRAAELTRDSTRIFSDDNVTVKLDVMRDRRNTLGFSINTAGARLDYIAVDNGRIFRPEFDTVWQAAVHVTETVWYAEFRLPATALGLSPVEGERVFGLEITRDHNLVRATYDWAPLPVELGAFAATHYGTLEGANSMATGRPLVVTPYVTGGLREDDPGRFPSGNPWSISAGGDVRLRLGQGVWGEVTVLTDFAEVDLDDPAVNLDRFPLFFPERRPFFLTGLDVFEFGDQGVIQPFFSRRIGLDDNRAEVPMLGGLKVYGRARLGPTTSLGVGLLQGMTYGDTLDSFSVARLRLNVGQASYLGAIATLRAQPETDRVDASAGADFLTRIGAFELRGFATGSFNDPQSRDADADDERGQGAAAQVEGFYRGQVLRVYGLARWIGEGYDPEVGFVRRDDYTQLFTRIQLQHRTRALGLETVDVHLRLGQDLDASFQQNLGRTGGLEVELSWVAGYYGWARADLIQDVVREDFTIAGRDVSAGTYDAIRYWFGFGRSSARNPSFSVSYIGQASFFGGVRQSIDGSLGIVATRHVRLRFNGSGGFIQLPGSESFAVATGSASLTIAPTTALQLDGVFQINTVSATTTGLARLRWRYRPGSDVFVVYQEVRPYRDSEQVLERRLLLKLTYRYDALL